MFDDQSIVVTLNGEGTKCKRILFETTDETLVRSAMLRLNCKKEDYTLTKVQRKPNK